MNAFVPAPPSQAHFVSGAVCVLCGHVLPAEYLLHSHVCPHHMRTPDEGILDIQYEYQAATHFFPGATARVASAGSDGQGEWGGLWRYRALFPLPWSSAVPPLAVGLTPLYDAPRLANSLGLRQVLVKDESRQPTASFKDRASCLAVALAVESKAPVVATASTGNAAAALAGMAAAMNVPCVIFVPESAPAAKVAQLQAFGARVFLVQGNYDQAFGLCMEACRRYGWYNRNTAYNPNMAEGKKSAAFEIAEQMNWEVPDAVFVGVGDGCIMAGLHKGFVDLVRMGRTRRIPRLYGVQAEGSDFLWQAQQEGRFSPEAILAKKPILAHTVADSIAAGLPRDRVKAMRAVRESGACFLRVSDQAILAAIPELAQATGVFAEPAGAASLAGLHAALEQKLVAPEEQVCLVATGSGLKDAAAVSHAPQRFAPVSVPPNVSAFAIIEQGQASQMAYDL